MQLGRLIIILEAEDHSIVRRSWMSKIFVTGDILSFVVQGLGEGDIVTRRYTYMCDMYKLTFSMQAVELWQAASPQTSRSAKRSS